MSSNETYENKYYNNFKKLDGNLLYISESCLKYKKIRVFMLSYLTKIWYSTVYKAKFWPKIMYSFLKRNPVLKSLNDKLFKKKILKSIPVVPWLSYSPLELRFAGSNPAGVDGFFYSVKILSMTSFGRKVKPWVPRCRFTARKRNSSRN